MDAATGLPHDAVGVVGRCIDIVDLGLAPPDASRPELEPGVDSVVHGCVEDDDAGLRTSRVSDFEPRLDRVAGRGRNAGVAPCAASRAGVGAAHEELAACGCVYHQGAVIDARAERELRRVAEREVNRSVVVEVLRGGQNDHVVLVVELRRVEARDVGLGACRRDNGNGEGQRFRHIVYNVHRDSSLQVMSVADRPMKGPFPRVANKSITRSCTADLLLGKKSLAGRLPPGITEMQGRHPRPLAEKFPEFQLGVEAAEVRDGGDWNVRVH